MREHRITTNITNRINMRHIGFLLFVDRNEATIIDDDSGFFSGDIFTVRATPNR